MRTVTKCFTSSTDGPLSLSLSLALSLRASTVPPRLVLVAVPPPMVQPRGNATFDDKNGVRWCGTVFSDHRKQQTPDFRTGKDSRRITGLVRDYSGGNARCSSLPRCCTTFPPGASFGVERPAASVEFALEGGNDLQREFVP